MSDDGRPRNDAACRRILSTKNHYEVLEVPCDAEEGSVKAAFRRRAREVHPDKNASPLASEAFKRLQKASEVLTDATIRRRYDRFGDDEPRPQPSFHPHSHGYQYHQYHYRGSREREVSPVAALMPFIAAMLVATFLFLFGGAILVETMEGGGSSWPGRQGTSWQKPQQKRKGPPEPPEVLHLTRQNADTACGVAGSPICVVLLTDPRHRYGEREAKLLEKLRADVESNVKTSRGQRMKMTWATAVAGPRWLPLLPAKVTFPWVAVLKPTRVGLRVCSMPVSKAGGKEKGRLSTGVPRLLQEIAAGSSKFEAVKGNASSLL